MIEDILNVNTIFYVSFVSLIIKMFKNSTLTEEEIMIRNDKKLLQIQYRKQKREDRIKRRNYRRELRRERLNNNDNEIVNIVNGNENISNSGNDNDSIDGNETDTSNNTNESIKYNIVREIYLNTIQSTDV